LLFHLFPGDSGYQSTLSGWRLSDGRSPAGSLRTRGAGYAPKTNWQIQTVASQLQAELFDVFLATQRASTTPITLIDRFQTVTYVSGAMAEPSWLSGYPVTNDAGYPSGFAAFLCLIDVDRSYRTFRTPATDLLQFQAVEA
jgi:hypothetical protein